MYDFYKNIKNKKNMNDDSLKIEFNVLFNFTRFCNLKSSDLLCGFEMNATDMEDLAKLFVAIKNQFVISFLKLTKNVFINEKTHFSDESRLNNCTDINFSIKIFKSVKTTKKNLRIMM